MTKVNYPIKIVIPINPITKKNNSRIFYRKSKKGKKVPFIAPSKTYSDYAKKVEKYLEPLKIDEPINVQAKYYRKTRHRVDLNNLHNALHDVMSDCEVIVDDNCKIIVGTDGSRVYHDKENPRTEIIITRAEPTFI